MLRLFSFVYVVWRNKSYVGTSLRYEGLRHRLIFSWRIQNLRDGEFVFAKIAFLVFRVWTQFIAKFWFINTSYKLSTCKNYHNHNAMRMSTSLLSAPVCCLSATGGCGLAERGVSLNTDINIESVGSVVSLNGKNVRLPLQAAPHWRQRGRKDMSALQIQRGLL